MITGDRIVTLDNLRREYGDTCAVDDVNLEIRAREFFSLIGPSGCGKTTTLRMIAGLEEPTSGRVLVGGRDLTSVPAFRRPVNTVFQNYALFPHLSVFENVAFGLRERKVPKADMHRKVREMLELVELRGRDGAKPRELSGGQQQRVALARSLVMEPQVLLLDEPLGALDLRLRKQMQTLLKRVQRQVGTTFVYVTHDQEEAFAMSDRVGVMRDGRIEQLGPPMDVYLRPRTRAVAEFVGASNRLSGTVEDVAGDRYSVALDALGETRVLAGATGLSPGSRASVVVRPEAVSLAPSASPGARLHGTLADVQYLGPHTTYEVRLDDGGTFLAAGNGLPPDGLPSLGTEVGVTWTDDAAWVVADAHPG